MGGQRVLGGGAVGADGGWELDLDLRLGLARLGANQLLTGVHLHLGGAEQVRGDRLLLLLLL